ncbi:multidrug effflux MFS transporter [Neptunicoccus sediminis]|uniref:multidrug effflux MFS transporter n=1 Tax=Neptunicoccus sediminis TaxID=1892596 RepID=UPI000845C377|nr:multidrug effflux MFS transporter [Neptunicoccus sediminis]
MFTPTSPPRFVTLVLLTAISVLSLNMFLPSLSNMARDFEVDYAVINLSIAGYLGVSAVLQIVMGPLSDRWGRRPVLLAAMAIFTVASIGCWLAPNVWVFLGFRLLQGAVIAGMALSRAVIRDMAPPQEAASMMGYVAMVMALAPMVGPVVGGLLDQMFGWRVTFLLFAVLGAGIFALCWRDLGETNTKRSDTLLAQFKTYPALLRAREFWGHVACQACSVGAFYVFLAGAPLVGEAQFGLTPAKLGLGMGAITMGFVFGNYLSGRYAKRYALSTLMIAGRIVALTGLGGGFVLLVAGIMHPLVLFGSVVFVGLGNGLTLPASNSGALSVRPDLAGSASGLSGAVVVGSGAILTSVTGAVLNETSGVFVLMSILFGVTILGLVAAYDVRTTTRR